MKRRLLTPVVILLCAAATAPATAFRLRGHAFPVDGPHGTRGAIDEFGAGRSRSWGRRG